MCLNAGRLWPSGRAIRLLWQSAFPRQKRRLWNGSASANTPGFVFLFFFFSPPLVRGQTSAHRAARYTAAPTRV